MINRLLAAKNKPITEDPPSKVDNNLRRHWNDYVNYLDKRGLKGNTVLDKSGAWDSVLEQYRKQNPATLITKESIPIIQKEFQNYRQSVIDKVKSGKAAFGDGVNENNFMPELSKIDGIAGSLTTNHTFPLAYLQTFENGNLINKENQGFATK